MALHTLTLTDLPHERVDALYVHIPFCFHKCHYCDFYSITHQTDDRMNTFVDRILHEADRWTGADAPPLLPRTVFFGGGTPSLLPIDAMQRLIRGLGERFDLSNVNEWTVEINPATADLEYCQMLCAAGVNRLSFGAQSFDRRELRVLERHHDPEEVPRSIDLARAAGFSRLNVDLIFGIPGQSMDSWMKSLDAALELRTPHISCYALTYEPNTPLAVKKRMGLLRPIEESLELEMLRETRARMRAAGYPPYEISNFAVPGEPCRHNLHYWNGGSYVALGPSAASHVHGWRWKNRPHLGEWERAVDAGSLPAADVESLTLQQRMGEYAMLRLRLTDGIDYAAFSTRWNRNAPELFADPITRFGRSDLLHATDRAVRLTERGVAVADALAAEFLAAAAIPERSSAPPVTVAR